MTNETKRILIQIGLFIATFITTTFAGAGMCYDRSVFVNGFVWEDFKLGMEFSIPLLMFLTCHEFGHYFMAIYHRVKTSLPYYIPFPPIPLLFNIGTLGAVIRLRTRPASSLQHFDIGLAGPVSGFVVALLILFYGFKTLPPAEHIFTIHPDYKEYGLTYADHVYSPEYYQKEIAKQREAGVKEGAMIDMIIGKNLVFIFFERFVADPARVPNVHEIIHYPVLMAGLFALLFTSLNLFPIGQLDGGHIVYGLFGQKRHKLVASFALIVLLFYSGLGFEYIGPTMTNNELLISIPLYVIGLFVAMTGLRWSKRDTAMYAVLMFAIQFGLIRLFPTLVGYSGWMLFAFVVGRFVGVQHPSSLIEQPLDTKRVVLGWITLIIFLLCFSPAPLDAKLFTVQQ